MEVSEELLEALVTFEGVLPKYLLLLLDPVNLQRYYDNLKDKGVYDSVIDGYYDVRVNRKRSSDREQFDTDEYVDWLKHHKDIAKLIGV